jgi:glycosyltransferase involved in cell wall biosynthesis
MRTAYHFWWRLSRLSEIANEVDGVIVFSCAGRYFDLVTVPVVWFCNKRNIPVVLSDRGGDTEDWLARSWRVRRMLRSVARACRGVHVSSSYLKRVFAVHGITAAAVPIVIDTAPANYRPRTARAGLIVNNRTMSRFHGVQLLIHVFAEIVQQHSGARLLITGSGDEFTKCRRAVRDLGLTDRVQFPGDLSRPEMIELLGRADLVVNTSTHDNIPNGILEAFASGVPVISSAVGGIPALIGSDECGYLVRSRCVQDFVAAINRSIREPDVTFAKVERARQVVHSMTWQVLRDEYFKVLIAPLVKAGTRLRGDGCRSAVNTG